MIRAIFFDLDGTLLPMDEKKFTDLYFSLLCKKATEYGYLPDLLMKTIWQGTKRMYLNDGKRSNEEVFWDEFASVYGEEKRKDKAIFDEFYADEFAQTIACCSDNPLAQDIVRCAKKLFSLVILSTNPIFPEVATLKRMSFVDLKKQDFDEITTYENSRYCKPNPDYFKDLLEKFSLRPDEVVLFGNNEVEDGLCASSCGIRTYMVGNFVIYDEKKRADFPHLNMEEVIPLLKRLKLEV